MEKIRRLCNPRLYRWNYPRLRQSLGDQKGENMKRKPGQIALDAIDASLCQADQLMVDMMMTTEDGKQAQAELRAWRRVVLACGEAKTICVGARYVGYYFTDKISAESLAKEIHLARKIEARRKP
jgi:uncharacterized protein (UPF0264 family)